MEDKETINLWQDGKVIAQIEVNYRSYLYFGHTIEYADYSSHTATPPNKEKKGYSDPYEHLWGR